MAERKMATIREVAEIKAIPEADKICAYRVDGWWIVDQVGKYDVGDLVVYAEPDSWVPTTLAPFLSKGKEPRVYNSVSGEKLRTIRLKKQLSQGLLLPLSALGEHEEIFAINKDSIGADVTEQLGIQRYEAPIAANLAGTVKGNFPSRIPKTDQERIQNLIRELEFWKEKGFTWEVSEKLDGSSMTVYLLDNEFGVCSRNLDLKKDENNTMWKVAIRNNFEDILRRFSKNLAIQGEIIGEGIQKNLYSLKGQEFFVYDIYDIDACRYFTPLERKAFVTENNIKHVPVKKSTMSLAGLSVDDILALAESKSVMGVMDTEQEGDVYKCNECEASFKAISNKVLLKEKD